MVEMARELEMTLEQDAEYFLKLEKFMKGLRDLIKVNEPSTEDARSIDISLEEIEMYFGMMQEHVANILASNSSVHDNLIELDKILNPDEYVNDEGEEEG
jgi:hypothetical protein